MHASMSALCPRLLTWLMTSALARSGPSDSTALSSSSCTRRVCPRAGVFFWGGSGGVCRRRRRRVRAGPARARARDPRTHDADAVACSSTGVRLLPSSTKRAHRHSHSTQKNTHLPRRAAAKSGRQRWSKCWPTGCGRVSVVYVCVERVRGACLELGICPSHTHIAPPPNATHPASSVRVSGGARRVQLGAGAVNAAHAVVCLSLAKNKQKLSASSACLARALPLFFSAAAAARRAPWLPSKEAYCLLKEYQGGRLAPRGERWLRAEDFAGRAMGRRAGLCCAVRVFERERRKTLRL